MSSRTFSVSRTVPVPVEEAFGRVLAAPLPVLFSRRYGPLPPVRETRGPDSWDSAGLARTVVTSDGGTMREELTAVERPSSFRYRISEVTGPMKPLASSVDGEWSFVPAGTGVRVTWTWTVYPASRPAALALPAFGRLWRGYARQALEEVERLLVE